MPPQELPAGTTLTVRGQHDVVVSGTNTLTPVFVRGPLGLCLQVPEETDTSGWRAQLTVNGRPCSVGPSPPAARLGRTLCFGGDLPDDLPAGEARLCGEVGVGSGASVYGLPCTTISLGGAGYDELMQSFYAAFATAEEAGLDAFLAQLDSIADRARAAGFPLLAARIDSVAVSFLVLEGTPQALARARELLASQPEWLDRPEAAEVALIVRFEAARLALTMGKSRRCWEILDSAEALFRRTADPRRLMVTMLQTEILAQAGALNEASGRLRSAIAGCDDAPCEERLVSMARSQLAWFLIVDPHARPSELDEAEQWVVAALGSEATSAEPLERVNEQINLAYLGVRQGRDPGEQLMAARAQLATAQVGEGRIRLLEQWARLIEGIAALSSQHSEEASALCTTLAAATRDADIASSALACAGRAHRLAGDLDAAADAFARALAIHQLRSDFGGSAQRLPIGPGQMADAAYRAARIAVERGRPEQAWEILNRIDRRSTSEEQRSACRERQTDPAILARWEQIESEASQLLATLYAADLPASTERRSQLGEIRRSTMERLQKLWREWPGCEHLDPDDEEQGYGFRAFALDDEILVLARTPDGQVSLARRTALPRDEVRRLSEEISLEIGSPGRDLVSWRELVAPLAAAVVPDRPDRFGAVTPYLLHGLLQDLPIGAMPVHTGTEGAPLLSELTTVVIRPGGVQSAPAVADRLQGTPLFVVDPASNLPSGPALVAFYQGLFPQAIVLNGAAATRSAVAAALTEASWTHVDAHGLYQPAFPELSSLRLADGPMTFIELVELPLPVSFTNLSGCQTGRWPITAGSGRAGIAGLLARRGVAWVVASRGPLDDQLAARFNAELYRAALRGATVPNAYSQALAEVRREYPPAAWAALCLVQGGRSSVQGAIRRRDASLQGGRSASYVITPQTD